MSNLPKPYYESLEGDIYQGDALDILKTMPDKAVHCCVTSPPYWGLRDYGIEGQLGLEKTPELYIEKMVEIFREVRRVLRSDGTLFLNLGDSYSQGGGAQVKQTCKSGDCGLEGIRGKTPHVAPKNLLGIPWRVALALQSDGWYLRSDIIWHKSNPMPESVQDRPTKAHEYVFLLTKSPKYFYDAEAVKEKGAGNKWGKYSNLKYGDTAGVNGKMQSAKNLTKYEYLQKYQMVNKRSVWTIPTKPFSGAHFAVFPPALIEPCILAGTSEKGCCMECGAPMERIVDYKANYEKREKAHAPNNCPTKVDSTGWKHPSIKTIGWRPTCKCNADTKPCIVLDPFFGSGTTGVVAYRHGRKFIGIELSTTYLDEIAIPRIKQETQQLKLFT